MSEDSSADKKLPVATQETPYAVPVEEGKTYYWCACGLSKKQPFCDGSHKGTAFSPAEFTATRTTTRYLCGCRATANPPYCDGSHNRL